MSMEAYEKVKTWLLSSGLCISDKTNVNVGGVHSFYDIKNQEYGFLYPEITGYNISMMKFLFNQENSEKYLEIAKLSAFWLMNIIDKHGGIAMGLGSDQRKKEIIFSFDTGICAKGLLDAYELTQDQQYKEYAKKLLDWISVRCLNDDGSIKPMMDTKSQKFIEDSTWYMKYGCFHIKVAIPFLQFVGNNLYSGVAKKICDNFTNLQNADGSFSLHLSSKIINLHTHCYAIEGLLYAFSVLKNTAYLESCKKGLEWAVSKINSDNSINLWFNYSEKNKACYPIAQLIRLLILIDLIEKNTKYKEIVERLKTFLLSLQALDSNPKINGGFYEEFYKSAFKWKRRDRINSWGSMFALQALRWVGEYEHMSFDDSIKQLF